MTPPTYHSVHDVLRRVQEVVQFAGIPLVAVDQRGIFGSTPLVIAAGWGDLEAVALLLAAGASIDAKGEDGETALHRAIRSGEVETVRLLLKAGASTTLRDDDGLTPLDAARQAGDLPIIHVLQSGT